MTLKTLKDIRLFLFDDKVDKNMKRKIKKEAIKWVKRDKKDFVMNPLKNSIANIITLRWMERFNIMEEDIK